MSWAFQCPFWSHKGKGTDESGICEGCRLKWTAGEEREAYFSRYCANDTGWRNCTIARQLLVSYERGLRK